MELKTLRQYSRDYAAGSIDRESYLRERRELLDKIVAGEIPVLAFAPPEPELKTEFPDDEEGDTTLEIDPKRVTSVSPARVGSPMAIIAVIVALLAVLAIGGWIFWGGDGDEAVISAVDEIDSPEVITTAAPQPVALDNSASALLDAFMEGNDWSGAAIEKFSAQWRALPATDRAEVIGSTALGSMTTAVLKQIADENALLGLNDPQDVLANQRRVLDLSKLIGIVGDRIEKAESDWQLANAEQERAATPQSSDSTPDDNRGVSGDAIDMPVTVTTPEPSSVEAAPGTDKESQAPVRADPPAPPGAREAEASVAATTDTPNAPAASAPAKEGAPKPVSSAPKTTAKAKTNCKPELAQTRRPFCIDVFADGEKGPVLVVIPTGTFTMGGVRAEESPNREVTISAALAVGMFEVSVKEFDAFCQAQEMTCPSQPYGDETYPVVNVTWDEANAYAQWLSERAGATYRLLSEAEWEFAARGGTTGPYPSGEEIVPTDARFSYQAPESSPLAANDRSVNRNGFKLYHMLGNVQEWVLDAWRENYADAPSNGQAVKANNEGERVVRGGSFASSKENIRAASRDHLDAQSRDNQTGFRIVRVLSP